jgi:peptidoglycan/LPS O-acetylase OafA/YrhL
MEGPTPRRSEHFPALDGLRALAVAAVVAYHLSPGLVPGGFLGVDLFFVLSGFLITRLLLDERLDTGRVRLGAFWGRRARRLLPGLFLVLVAVAVAGMLLPGTLDPYSLRGDALAALFYYANWHFLAVNQSYFGHVALPSPLEQTWSLSIEEQFYLVWPLVLLGLTAVMRRRSPRALLVPILVLAAASVAAMAAVYGGGGGREAAYFGTECRAFELLAGAAAAVVLRGRATDLAHRLAAARAPSRLLQAAGLAALAGIVAAIAVCRPGSFVFDGGLALVAVGAATLLVASLGPGPLRRVLSTRPLRAIGRVSYEIYLWHWPVIVVGDQVLHLGGLGRAAVEVALTLLLAVASYRLVDAPLRRARYDSLLRRAALPVSVAATSVVVLSIVPLSGVAAASSAASLGRITASSPRPAGAAPGRLGEAASVVFGVHLGPPVGRIDLGFAPSSRHRVRLMYIGDSVMYQLELALAAALDSTGDATTAQYGAILGWSPRMRSTLPTLGREIARTHPDLVVAMWTQDNVVVATHGIAAYEREVLDPLLGVLLRPGDGVRGVIFVAQPPQPPRNSWMPDVHADVYDPRGMVMWEETMREEARRMPGRIAFVPATQMLELDHHYTTWLWSPGGSIERVRQIDDFHLCLNGGVRYGAGAVAGITRLLALPSPRPNWWLGSFAEARRWYQLPKFPPGMCPADAPATLHGRPG